MPVEWFVRLKNELFEILFTTKMIVCQLLLGTLHSLWIVITCQEDNWIKKKKILAEQDGNNIDHQVPNEFIQGAALTVCIITFILFKYTLKLILRIFLFL
jgi:hypothetical protein